MIRRRYKTFTLLVITTLVLACVPAIGPAAPAPIPTFDPNFPLTAIVQTAGAAATQTALLASPTSTPTTLPSSTPTDTPTPTPTFLFIVRTITQTPSLVPVGSSGLDYECQVISQEPLNESMIPKNTQFTARWVVINVGKSSWDSDNTDYRYTEGDKLHQQSVYDLPASIVPGVTVELTVSMLAPSEPGTYTTSWRVGIGKSRFCPMNLTINVQ